MEMSRDRGFNSKYARRIILNSLGGSRAVNRQAGGRGGEFGGRGGWRGGEDRGRYSEGSRRGRGDGGFNQTLYGVGYVLLFYSN